MRATYAGVGSRVAVRKAVGAELIGLVASALCRDCKAHAKDGVAPRPERSRGGRYCHARTKYDDVLIPCAATAAWEAAEAAGIFG